MCCISFCNEYYFLLVSAIHKRFWGSCFVTFVSFYSLEWDVFSFWWLCMYVHFKIWYSNKKRKRNRPLSEIFSSDLNLCFLCIISLAGGRFFLVRPQSHVAGAPTLLLGKEKLVIDLKLFGRGNDTKWKIVLFVSYLSPKCFFLKTDFKF